MIQLNRKERHRVMTAVTIISGFFRCGKKTTLIREFMKSCMRKKERIVLIENEFGDIGIDAAFWKIPALRSRRSAAVVFVVRWSVISKTALLQVLEQFHPDRIIIEPSGVGKTFRCIKGGQRSGCALIDR